MTTEAAKPAEPARLGRKRDHSRDPEILEAALDVLSEVGYEKMTVDMVAARAKAGKATLYRRWPSKADLILDAIACMKQQPTQDGRSALCHLPDTGTLRGDLRGMARPKALSDSNRHLKVMLGLASMMLQHPDLVDTIQQIMVKPRKEAFQAIFQRAIDRCEIQPGVDVELLASLGPALAMHGALFQHRAPSQDRMLTLIDEVILPAVGLSAAVEGADE